MLYGYSAATESGANFMSLHKLLTGLLLLSSSSAFGSLVLKQQIDLSGTGLGTVPTILTQQDKGGTNNDPTGNGFSSGCVGVAPGGGDLIGPDACIAGTGVQGGEEKNGASQTLT